MSKLPGIPSYRTEDRALASTLGALIEHAEVHAGGRGRAGDKVATLADIAALQRQIDALTAPRSKRNESDVLVDLGNGAAGTISLDVLVDSLMTNRKFNTAIAATATVDASISTTASDANRVEAELRAAIEELQSRLGSDASTGAAAFELRDGKVALKPEVVLFESFSTKVVFDDIRARLYNGTIQSKVSLTPDSILFDGQTVQAVVDSVNSQIGGVHAQLSTKLAVVGNSAGSPGTAFTHTLFVSHNGFTARVPIFYP